MPKTTNKENFFNYKGVSIPYRIIQHVEQTPNDKYFYIITCQTRWNFENNVWENPLELPKELYTIFFESWTNWEGNLQK